MNPIIEKLQNSQLVWRGFEHAIKEDLISTNYPLLDQKLKGGLPQKGVIEIKTLNGIGEIRVLAQYLHQQHKTGLIFFIAPPAMISSEFFSSIDIDINQIYVITPATDIEALWCAELCLKSESCACVLLWQHSATIHQTKRLSLATEQGKSSLFFFRPYSTSLASLPAQLSLCFTAHPLGIAIAIDKYKGGRTSSAFVVSMAKQWPELNGISLLSKDDQLISELSDIQVS